MIPLTVNGTARDYKGDPEMPLLWFLRDTLQLTGAKFGCGEGLCGACTVHVNGEAMPSCSAPMKGLQGKKVVTIEGLSVHALRWRGVARDVANKLILRRVLLMAVLDQGLV